MRLFPVRHRGRDLRRPRRRDRRAGGSQSCPAACYDHRRGIYVEMVCDYLFWYTAFTIPSALAATLQGFGRNDGAPVFVMVSTIVSTALNIFLDWLFVFPLKQGLAGADHRVLHEPCDHPVSAGGQRQRLLGHQLCGRLCLCRVYRYVRGDAAAVRAELRR